MASGVIHRIKSKIDYHLSSDHFEKQVAEINRYKRKISVVKDQFKVFNCETSFYKVKHGFLIERFEEFQVLLTRGEFIIENDLLIYHFKNLQLPISTAEELFIIREIFIDHIYNYEFEEENTIVVDVGMNVGFASLFFANNSSVEKVYSFEPFSSTFKNAQRNLSYNKKLATKIHVAKLGWGFQKEEIEIRFSEHLKGKNSVLGHSEGKKEKIQLENAYMLLNEICHKNSEKKIFIKMDCEGAEFDIFRRFEKTSIPEQVIGFILEWHAKSPEPIINVLKKNKFRVLNTGIQEIGFITAFRYQ